jgi:hypothetical protein
MAGIYHGLRLEKPYRASAGLGKNDFGKLLKVFEKYYHPKGASPVPNTRPPALADKREALFFVLHYLKAHPTLGNMGPYSGMDVRTVSSYPGRTRAALRAALSGLGPYCFNLFKDQEGSGRASEGAGELVVGCTEARVQRPNDPDIQHLVYSGKKRPHREAAGRVRPEGAGGARGPVVVGPDGRHHHVRGGVRGAVLLGRAGVL